VYLVGLLLNIRFGNFGSLSSRRSSLKWRRLLLRNVDHLRHWFELSHSLSDSSGDGCLDGLLQDFKMMVKNTKILDNLVVGFSIAITVLFDCWCQGLGFAG
jgi:hypothetical protein